MSAMKKVQLGRSNLQVSVACLGTAPMGSLITDEDCFAILDHFRSRGGNFIDTAEIYPAPIGPQHVGRSEEVVGRWLQARGCRDDFVVATKVTGPLQEEFAFAAQNRTVPKDLSATADLTGQAILDAAEGSLRRLQLDRIDLYQIHWPARHLPVFGRRQFTPAQVREAASCEELVGAMGRLIEGGKIRHWGLSNETAYGVTAMCEAAKRLGVPLPVSVQNDYSLCDRHFDLDIAEACHAYGLVHLPYGALGGGYLSGKYRGGARPEGTRHTMLPDFQPRYATPAVAAAVERYAEVAQREGISLTQLAVAWAASRWHVAAVVTGFMRVSQMDEYLDAFAMELSPETLRAIDDIHMENRNPQWID